uniref:Leucine rich immune protein (Coil-less) n=1 Tax=Anopheles atroparvus TaxID=41427 RepID=A0A182IM65_ANOAO
MKSFARLALFLVTCGAAARAEYSTHRCVGGSEAFVCTIVIFGYNPEKNIPQFHLPKDVKAIRFVRSFYITRTDECISAYDALLHKQLNSPVAIEARYVFMHTIEMPSNVEYADFTDNLIQTIGAPSNQSYALRYLNLNENHKIDASSIVNISRFVNLETLYIADCSLEQIPSGIFDKLTRLTRLFIGGNDFTQLDLSMLPSSLSVLNLDNSYIRSFSFPSNHFPALEHLNFEFNKLRDVDIEALLAMAPKLKLFALGHNEIKRARVEEILGELDRRNVAYYNTELPSDSECQPDERKFRGLCIPESSFPLEVGDWIEIVLLVALAVSVLLGVVIGGMKLWAKYPPSWEFVNYFNRRVESS